MVIHVQLSTTSWTIAHHTPLSMEFSRQEYWNELPFEFPGFLTPRNLPNPGIKPTSLASPALAGGFFTTSATWDGLYMPYYIYI